MTLSSPAIFQSTLPRRERPRFTSNSGKQGLFQSTLPRRERLKTMAQTFVATVDFNPRSREGSDGYMLSGWHYIKDFNPRSREGSDIFSMHHFTISSDFNPRSREGSDDIILWKTWCWKVISIHAPAKGATGNYSLKIGEQCISIHAPAKGATKRGDIS